MILAILVQSNPCTPCKHCNPWNPYNSHSSHCQYAGVDAVTTPVPVRASPESINRNIPVSRTRPSSRWGKATMPVSMPLSKPRRYWCSSVTIHRRDAGVDAATIPVTIHRRYAGVDASTIRCHSVTIHRRDLRRRCGDNAATILTDPGVHPVPNMPGSMQATAHRQCKRWGCCYGT